MLNLLLIVSHSPKSLQAAALKTSKQRNHKPCALENQFGCCAARKGRGQIWVQKAQLQESGEDTGIHLGMGLMKMDRSSNERHQVTGEDKIRRRRCQKCNPIVLVSALDNWTGLTVLR